MAVAHITGSGGHVADLPEQECGPNFGARCLTGSRYAAVDPSCEPEVSLDEILAKLAVADGS